METPIVRLSDEELQTVYEPSEDSFLLIDALESDLEHLRAMKPVMCLEIGSGSGIVITALAMALKKSHPAYYLALDINPDACRATKKTTTLNSVEIDILQMNLLTFMRDSPCFDVIVFNPPYVVTEDEELSDERLLSKTWAGGQNGRKVMERVFTRIPQLLSNCAVFYLLVIKENDPDHILAVFEKMNLHGVTVAERKIRGEHLYVLRFTKTS